MAPAHQPTMAGDQVGDYRLIEVLGRGGMGIVYRAQHVRLQKEVALKLLSDDAIRSPKALQRFEREMQVVGRLEHPNVVNALDAGDFQDRPFLTMELIRGVDLTQLVEPGDLLPVADACELVRQAAIGLQYAHAQGLIHRDVKPANLMLTLDPLGDPIVKVMDLGLAQITEAGMDELTDQGQLMGTLKYMAPEQAAGDGRVDFKADIYALGGTLFRLLTGDVPFEGTEHNTPVKRLQSLTGRSAPSIAARRDDLPADLVGLIDQMLDRDAANRPESMKQVAAGLANFCDGHTLQQLAQTTRQEPAPTNDAADVLVAKPEIRPKEHRTFPLKWVLSILCCLAIFSGVIWLRQTDGTYLRIDADPNIDVSIELIEDRKPVDTFQVGKNQKQFWCKSGKYIVRLPAGVRDSLTLEGADLTVTRGENTVVRIRRVRATDIATNVTDSTSRKNSEPIRTSRPTAREAVERVLSKDGRAVVTVGDKRIHIDGTSQIPKVPFEFRGVAGKTGNRLNDEDCRYLAQLDTIDQLWLVWSNVTEDGFKEFAGRKQIVSLSIPRALTGSDSIAALFPNLRYVSPAYPEIEQFTASIRNNPNIVVLRVFRSQMPPIACSNVAAMPNLKFLDAEDAELKGEDIRLISKSTTLQHLRMTLHADMDVSDLAPLAEMKTLKSIQVKGPSSSLGRHDFAEKIKKLLPKCEYITNEDRHNRIRYGLIGLRKPGGVTIQRLSPDADVRTFAKWLIGRKSHLRTNGVWARKLSDLPDEEMLPGPIVATRLTDGEIRELVDWMNHHTAWAALNLKNVALTDECVSAISQLPHLNFLGLGQYPISDSGVRKLTSSLHIKILHLNPSAMTIAGWRDIQQTQTKLRDLSLNGPSLLAESMGVIAEIQSLRELTVWTMPVSADWLIPLGGSAINTFAISGDEPIPTEFGAQLHRLEHLETLTIGTPSFGDEHLAQFSIPPCLKTIELRETLVTADGASKFKLQHPQVELIVDGKLPPITPLAEPSSPKTHR